MAIQRPCPDRIICPVITGPAGSGYFPDPDSPFANLSSEAPDPVDYLAMWFFPNNPPINSSEQSWNPTTGVGFGNGITPKWAAEEALRNAQDNAWENHNGPVFGNEEQTCIAYCDDGSTFQHTIEAGRFQALSQKEANAMALSYCANEAELLKLCFLTINLPSTCVDSYYDEEIQASGGIPTIYGNAYFWEISSGTLPPGLTLNSTNGGLTGYPSAGGSYTFTVQITDGNGSQQSREFTILVAEITTAATLASGAGGWVYKGATLACSPAVPVATWSVVAGSLPTGLTLSTAGVISGTPDISLTAATHTFTVEAKIGDLKCEKEFTIKIWANDNTVVDSPAMAYPGTTSYTTAAIGPGMFRLEYFFAGNGFTVSIDAPGSDDWICAIGAGQGYCPSMPPTSITGIGVVPGYIARGTAKGDVQTACKNAMLALNPLMEFELSSTATHVLSWPTWSNKVCGYDSSGDDGSGIARYDIRRIGKP